ncbi:Glycerophosphocholine phosphodiesterase [Elasticomyces elasticus]|nr:Glycerophosphocholine phosphodiesterase [Elasticomyces elasticus]
MKFGQNLVRNQVPEWAPSYINYKGLKKLIKSAQHEVEAGGSPDLAEFFYALDRNLEDVDTFYNRKYAEFSRRLRLLHDRYGQAAPCSDGMDKEEMGDLMGTLLELRGQYRKLQWYGEVNRRGFIKITKKLDKKIPTAVAQRRYLLTKVDPKQFATNYQLTNDMRAINDWLSNLGEVKVFDDTASSHSTVSLHRVSSRTTFKLAPSVLDAMESTIRGDDSSTLSRLLSESRVDTADLGHNRLVLNLLQRAISCRASSCIEELLRHAPSLNEDDDMNKRNCIHRLIIATGRARALEDQNGTATLADFSELSSFIPAAEAPARVPPLFRVEERDAATAPGRNDPAVKILIHLLDNLRVGQRDALTAHDSYGRLPLHYSAQYGLVATSQELISHMQRWGQFEVSKGIDSAAWQDSEGYAPLHYSVVGGHFRTTMVLLLAENWQGETDEKIEARKHVAKSGAVLTLATKSNFHKIVKLLVEAGVDVNYQDEQGETALHIAARFSFEDCAKALLEGSDRQQANLELAEKTFGWTPLFIACVDGHLAIVDLLIAAGAELARPDLSGWTPKEHAALRGHLTIAQRLADLTPLPADDSPQPDTTSSSPPNGASLEDRRSNGIAKDITAGAVRAPEPVKTFGHRYLIKESMVLVSLGSMDIRKNVEAVKLDSIPLADAHATQLDTALSVVVSASGAAGEPTVIDLPVQENISTSPITFMTSDASKVKLLFDIVPTYAGSSERRVGRGVALLSSIKPTIGSKRINLQGDLSVPIVAAETLDVIGSVNFNFLIITPFAHPNMTITEDRTYWKRMASTMVIGHRGLGKNMAARKSLQLGENTIESFIAAANLGASYVELTKDHVPVIYHDFLVSETGVDAPVHTLTLEQFLHASEGQTPRPSRPASPTVEASGQSKPNGKPFGRKQRSYSVGAPDEEHNADLKERMKHTRDFKIKGYKGNSRGNFIQSPFTTLEEMFKKLPESIGFNIEMKYPMLFESEEHEMDTYAVELNSFVDAVLTKVYDLGKKRNIIFSSFNPDICLILSFKQPSIPVLFLTDAGTSPAGDIRATSLQEAIRFASRWNLLGVVSAAEPLVICPRLVKVVKESGLVCVSYGALNNDPKNVKLQVREGIDAVIVDSVLAIRKGLTGPNETVTGNGAGPNSPNEHTTPISAAVVADTVNDVSIYGNGNVGRATGAILA